MSDQPKSKKLKKHRPGDISGADLGLPADPSRPSGSDQTAVVTLADIATSTSQKIHQQKPSKAFEEACEIAEQLFGIVRDVSEATELLSPLKSASMLMLRGINAVKTVHTNSTGWVDLCNDLIPHVTQMEEWKVQFERNRSSVNRDCPSALNKYLSIAAEVIKTAAVYGDKRANVLAQLKRAGTAQTEKDEIARLRQKVTNMWQAFMAAMNKDTYEEVGQLQDQLTMHGSVLTRLADHLGVPSSQTVYGTNLDDCEDGTRTEILSEIRKWAADIETEKQIFWLNDAGGTGKSTIAATMAREWQRSRILAGRFFFSPNDLMERTIDRFCLTLAEDIAVNQPIVSTVVRKAIRDNPLGHFSFDQQFEQIIVKPLKEHSSASTLCIVIDALDNCDDPEQRERLLRTLLKLLPLIKSLKVLLTSRPLQDIMDTLRGCVLVDGGGIQLLDSQNHKHKDIELYIEKRLANNSMVSNEQRRLIAEQSGGLFLYAATVCRLLADRRRASMLRTLLATGSSQSLVEKMNQLYFSILKQVSVDDTLDKYIMDVLSAIIVAFKPLSVDVLCEYLPEDIPVSQTVKLLGAVLKCDDHEQPIKILHPTFREFLLSSDAGTYSIDPGLPHMEMACSSMDILERSLCYNLLQIDGADQFTPFNNAVSDLDDRISKYMTPATQYASIFWANHAIAAESTTPRCLWSRVVKFLSTMFLNWVELMSWKGEMTTCVNGLFRLHVKAKQIHSKDARIITQDELLAITHAYQFVVNHQAILSDSALQVYSVPLFFTPARSPLFSHYRQQHRLQQPNITTPLIIDWDSRFSLGSHADYIQEYLFSPDVTRLLTVGGLKGGGDELFLWDTETGAILRKLLCGNQFRSCSFSPDGQHLAILAKDQVHIHSSDTGETIVAPFQVTFENSKLLGSFPCLFSSEKSCITVVTDTFAHIFDFKMGIEVQAIDIHDGRCISGAIFSPNQTRLATLAHNGSQTHVTAWDLENLQVISSEAVDKHLIGGKFSPDGARLATWGLNYCQLWSLSVNQISIITKSIAYPLEGVLFSSSGNYCALQSIFDEIEVWNCKTGVRLCAVEIPGDGGVFFSFSEDKQKLGVLTLDEACKLSIFISEISSGTTLEGMVLDHIMEEIPSRCGLPIDGAKWFSIWGNNSLEICKLMYCKKDVGIRRHTRIYSALTALGPLFVIAKFSREHEVGVQVWSLAGNTISKSFKPGIILNAPLCNFIFSPNGQRIAIAFLDVGLIYIWNTQTWDEEIFCGQGFIESCIFSPNSELLSALFMQLGNDKKRQYTLRVWNLQTLEVIWKYNFTSDNFWGSLIFSPDSTSILICLGATIIYLSNFGQDTRILQKEVEGQMKHWVKAAFSSSGALVAVSREYNAISQKEIQLWQIDTSLKLLNTIQVDTHDVPRELIFSSDEKYLVYGRSHCWDISTFPAQQYMGNSPPPVPFTTGSSTHSFLAYEDGWIHSVFPPMPLVPVPNQLRSSSDTQYLWFGDYLIVSHTTFPPTIFDCSIPLTRLRLNLNS